MTPEQRKALSKKVLNVALPPEVSQGHCKLSVSLSDWQHPTSVPLYTVKNIWATAEFILSNYHVQQLFGGNMCISDDNTAYTVKVCSGYTLKCHCQQLARTNGLCCHVKAVAEKGGFLQKFLEIYAKNGDDPNRIVQNNLPPRAGSLLRTLRRDEHGISSFLSIYPVESNEASASSETMSQSRPSNCAHRQIIREALHDSNAPSTSACSRRRSESVEISQREEDSPSQSCAASNFEDDHNFDDYQPEELQFKKVSTQMDQCVGCEHLSSENNHLKNLWIDAKHKLAAERNEISKLQRKLEYVEGLFATTMKSINEGLLTVAMKKLKEATPPPLCAGFDKKNREEAIEKQEQRKRMVTQEVPATSSGKMEKGHRCHHEASRSQGITDKQFMRTLALAMVADAAQTVCDI
eukprot:gene9800-18361_t